MDAARVEAFVSKKWDDDIVPQLVDYIRIPCKSPMFDAEWAAHGYIDQAIAQMNVGAHTGDRGHDARGRAPGRAARH